MMKKGSTKAWVVILVIVLIVIGIIWWWFWMTNRDVHSWLQSTPPTSWPDGGVAPAATLPAVVSSTTP